MFVLCILQYIFLCTIPYAFLAFAHRFSSFSCSLFSLIFLFIRRCSLLFYFSACRCHQIQTTLHNHIHAHMNIVRVDVRQKVSTSNTTTEHYVESIVAAANLFYLTVNNQAHNADRKTKQNGKRRKTEITEEERLVMCAAYA